MENISIGFVGLGYVGLPTSCLFAMHYPVIGYDTNSLRVSNLQKGCDTDGEVDKEVIDKCLRKGLKFTDNLSDLQDCNYYIVVVPTPINNHNEPDLSYIKAATQSVGQILKPGDTVIYESTVYPGVTEEVCVPILEQYSHLKYNVDFTVGYSPERVVPGDKNRQVADIVKITSGSNVDAANRIDRLYQSVLNCGTYLAPSIKVAEAAKVVENTQRDINIAFINELATVFQAMDIDTNEVIDAAASKWNFQAFRPGLVGGHCISVDPYYLIGKAKSLGVNTPVMETARKVNNQMPIYIADQVVMALANRNFKTSECRILLLGITFKEDCMDIRNSKVADIYKRLRQFTDFVEVYDPIADLESCSKQLGIDIVQNPEKLVEYGYQAIVLCVCHRAFANFDFSKYKAAEGFVYDVKGKLEHHIADYRL